MRFENIGVQFLSKKLQVSYFQVLLQSIKWLLDYKLQHFTKYQYFQPHCAQGCKVCFTLQF